MLTRHTRASIRGAPASAHDRSLDVGFVKVIVDQVEKWLHIELKTVECIISLSIVAFILRE